MSKKALVKLAEVLNASGYSTPKVLSAIGFPKIESVTVTATAIDEHLVDIYIKDRSIEIKSSSTFDAKDVDVMPMLDHVESSVRNDGSGDWSISRSLLFVKFEGGNSVSHYFGNASTGPETDKEIPVTHRISLPSDPQWPTPSFLIPKYPVTP